MFELELSAEACEEKAAAVLPATCLQHLDSSLWKERLSSLEAFEKAVEEMERSTVPCQALVRLLVKDPGWKETKLQVVRKKLHLVTLIAQRGNFSRASAHIVLDGLVDQLGDVICSHEAKSALTAVAEACSLPWTAGKVVDLAFLQEKPRTQAEALSWLANAILEFGFAEMEVKTLADTIKAALAAVHPDVRTSALTLLGVVSLYVGAPVRALFEGEKPPLLSLIDAELQKVQGQSPPAPTRGSSQPGREEGMGGDAGDCGKVEAVDVHTRIPSELVQKMWDGKMRKEGLDEVAGLLLKAGTIHSSLGELPAALRACLHDADPAVVEKTLQILRQLATAAGPGLKQHVKDLGVPLFATLWHSQGPVRAAALEAVNAWAEQTSLQEWLDGEDFLEGMRKETPLAKQEPWEKPPGLCSAPSELLLACVPHLYACLEDCNAGMRAAAQGALPFFVMHLGTEKMAEATSTLKPREKYLVPTEPERAKTKPCAPSQSLSNLPRAAAGSASDSSRATPPSMPACPAQDQASSSPVDQKPGPEEAKTAGSMTQGTAKVKPDLKEGGSQLGPIFILVPKGKEQRVKDEQGHKVLRWDFKAPSSKYVEQLKAQMGSCVSSCLQEEMFHSSFQHHIKALAIMVKHLEREKDAVISCLDLILKWLTLRFFDSNTWVLTKSLEYLRRLFALLSREKYQLTENEARAFLPYLILKMGELQEAIFKEMHAVLKRLCLVYPASKVASFILEGAKSKSAQQQARCLEELGYLVGVYGIHVCQPHPGKALRMIAALLRAQNHTVRQAACNVIVTASNVYGKEVFKLIGTLSEKQMKMLQGSLTPRANGAAQLARGNRLPGPRSSPHVCTGAEETLPPNLSHTLGMGMGLEGEPPAPQAFQLDADGSEDVPGMVQGEIPKLDGIPSSQAQAVPTESVQHDMANPIDLVIYHVASSDVNTSLQALMQMDGILGQPDKVGTMQGHVNQFLEATLWQLQFIHSLQGPKKELGPGRYPIIRLYRSILSNLLSLFQRESLAREASAAVLTDLLRSLIAFLLGSQMQAPEEEQEVTQSLNLLLKKVLETSDQTRAFTAVLTLLRESLEAAGGTPQLPDLVAKCLWRITRLLPRTLSSLHLDHVLLDLHTFLRAFPTEALKQCASKLPLQALKTLLHTLCELKGAETLDHLTLIGNKAESELEAHLRTAAEPLAKQAPSEPDPGVGNGDAHVAAKGKIEDVLEGIFQKIGSKESTREGLEELYEYKRQCPEADLEPFLQSLSLFSRSYIKQGLAMIQVEKEGRPHTLPRQTTGTRTTPIPRWEVGLSPPLDTLKPPRQGRGPSSMKPPSRLPTKPPGKQCSRLPRYTKIPGQKEPPGSRPRCMLHH
ncbi:cytoskeleton-associated protein 5-like [Alligator mississippiensis]|uniref:cytoskeleton-associated protein 5-like n=1 Tax=Alligator mississippiensis TaxID=8496 RepID=UPI002877EB6A|nr:cytoskeleton-associated protein 5-like [Alligator mississippiensis]